MPSRGAAWSCCRHSTIRPARRSRGGHAHGPPTLRRPDETTGDGRHLTPSRPTGGSAAVCSGRRWAASVWLMLPPTTSASRAATRPNPSATRTPSAARGSAPPKGRCCTPTTCQAGQCGVVANGCGGTVACDCPSDLTCASGQCVPTTTTTTTTSTTAPPARRRAIPATSAMLEPAAV